MADNPAPSDAPGSASADNPAPSDFLSPAPDSQAEECDKPVSSRTGNWVCFSTTPASATEAARNASKALGSDIVTEQDIAAVAAGYCTTGGCWDKIDTTHSTYSGTGTYGYGGTPLGGTQLYFKITTNGSLVTTYPFWISTARPRRNVEFISEHLYMSTAYPGGNSQNPRKIFNRTNASGGAAGVATNWPSPGPSSRNAVAWVTVANEAKWSDSSSAYPGQWFMWAKSIEMQKQQNGSYYVQSDNALPNNAYGAGYRR